MTLEKNPRGLQAVQVSAVFSAVALIVLVLRVYTRVFIVRHFGVEDGFAVFGMVRYSNSYTGPSMYTRLMPLR